MYKKPVSIIEFEKIGRNELTESDYTNLQELCFKEEYKDILSCYNGKICFKNYAGILQLKNGSFFEVLPKICLNSNEIIKSRNIFKKMIATLKCDYYKSFTETRIGADNFPLLEVFISIFLSEIEKLIQLGLRKNYIKVSENTLFVKGKLKIAENIKYNHSHQERNFIEYNNFIENTPENIILKTCICFLKDKSQDFNNRKKLTQNLFLFDNVEITSSPEREFQRVSINRLNKYYEAPLELAKVFLTGNNFMPKLGNINSLSLLFPVEKLFEDYVFFKLNKEYRHIYRTIKAQSHPYKLIDSTNKFQLKPDITMENEEKIVIMDTKWKLLNSSSADGEFEVSQGDLYQLYAYGKKYQNKTGKKIELYLIYPATEKFNKSVLWNYEVDKSLPITIAPFDLEKSILIKGAETMN